MLLLDQKKDWKKKLTSASCRAHARSPGSAAVSPALRCRFSSASPSSSLSRPRASLTMLERETQLGFAAGLLYTHAASLAQFHTRPRAPPQARGSGSALWVSQLRGRASSLASSSLSFFRSTHSSIPPLSLYK